MRSDANARPKPERQIGVAVHRWRTRHETLGIKSIGIGPAPPMAVQHPRRDHDDVARLDLHADHFVALPRRARDHKGWWIKAHGLIDDRARVDKAAKRRGAVCTVF